LAPALPLMMTSPQINAQIPLGLPRAAQMVVAVQHQIATA
jgi:hypothetical protein